MGLIDRVREALPTASDPEPQSDVTAADFDRSDSSEDGTDGEDGSSESGESDDPTEPGEPESGAGDEPDEREDGAGDDSDEAESEIDDDESEISDDTHDDATDDGTDGADDGDDDPDDGPDDEGDGSGDVSDELPDDTELPDEFSRPDDDIEGGKAKHHVDEDRLEELKDRSLDESVEDRYDVDLDYVDKVDDRDRARWASLVRQIQEYELDIEERKRERDERIESRQAKYEGYKSDRLGEGLERRARREGVINELEEGFRQLVSRRTPEPARVGPQVDMQNVVRRAAGDVTVTELFEEEVITETGDRCIGLATDISGSMGSAIDELKIAGGCIAEATQIVGDEFVWEAFTDKPSYHGSTDALDLRIVTGPNEQFSWEHTDSFGSARNEPTAAGIRDCAKLMQETDANEYVLICITDGMALITEDGRYPSNNEPVEQAREAVNECRAQGFEVIGLGIGSMDEGKMEETFGGRNYRLTTIDSLADDILELYREQMNVKRR